MIEPGSDKKYERYLRFSFLKLSRHLLRGRGAALVRDFSTIHYSSTLTEAEMKLMDMIRTMVKDWRKKLRTSFQSNMSGRIRLGEVKYCSAEHPKSVDILLMI